MTPAFVHESAVIDTGVLLGDGVKVWHFCHVMANATIGDESSLGQNCFVGAGVSIGPHCRLQNNVSVFEGVTLEEGVFCGPSAVFTNDPTPRALHPKNGAYVATVVKRGASIGANATIVCGVSIGAHAMVAAGAVVTHDVRRYALVAGVPAREVGWVCECGLPLDAQTWPAVCSCGRRYSLVPDGLIEVNRV